MASTLIRASGVGKSYILQHQAKGWDKNRTLRDELAQRAKSLFQPTSEADSATARTETFWALKDVSFAIQQGEAVGFIGHNGAGKSTLLKLLSRITEPTTGEIEITGRLASLLEVSTGFHPELTGRENIFLKGAISGMKRATIKAKFDEIVAFAEIDRFLDTPVKKYSSGMYVKLGFAVAAHLDPEILVVDEALAVGDASFQKKCIDKMQSIVTGEGRTLLFVSHNLSLMQSLCSRAILLYQGSLIKDGPAKEVVEHYMGMADQANADDLTTRRDRTGVGGVRLTKLEICSGQGHRTRMLTAGCPAQIVLHLDRIESATSCSVIIYRHDGVSLARLDNAFHGPGDRIGDDLGNRLVCHIDELPLTEGKYRIGATVQVGNVLHDHIQYISTFEVENGAYKGRTLPSARVGIFFIEHRWSIPPGAQP